MNYSESEFYALMESVEQQGGEHLDKMCKAKTYKMVNPKSKPVTIAGCGNSALFKVPYDALDKSGATVTVRAVEVCAVDDDMGRWPRFGGDRFAGPEHYVPMSGDDL